MNREGAAPPAEATGLRVLLAEDDIPVAKGYQDILQKAGYEVVGLAHDGLQAVEMCENLRPDLLLMDIKMPRMDGLEAARAINMDPKSAFTPIVLVTAYADQQLVTRAKRCGVLGYLVKPVQLDDLIPALEMAHTAAQKISALEGAVRNLSEELEARKVVERAKGILMKRLKIDEEEALRMMQKESRRQRIKLKDLARAIISSHSIMNS
ncbi:response regulator [Dissulfurirhabdus thermomarina]|uniref:Response regulator n=1 Tax=Dissulfurirhabdus thermomarina TaxID=1765737 RepID=A0A6N9TMY1_DISTH|nr:response regulator [Dissulfurirhabdus thermomarina]NDY42642.1 response regulator [Dissulfurirhabdus thermomarina]NMX22688.1 response regulator [Dissulfurirhabdus thermomarina]